MTSRDFAKKKNTWPGRKDVVPIRFSNLPKSLCSAFCLSGDKTTFNQFEKKGSVLCSDFRVRLSHFLVAECCSPARGRSAEAQPRRLVRRDVKLPSATSHHDHITYSRWMVGQVAIAVSGCSRQRLCCHCAVSNTVFLECSWYQNGTICSYGVNLNVSLTSQIYVSALPQIFVPFQ